MCYAGFKGCDIDLSSYTEAIAMNYLFSEVPGIVIEIKNTNIYSIKQRLDDLGINNNIIGNTNNFLNFQISTSEKNNVFKMMDLVQAYEKTASKIEKKQANIKMVEQEIESLENKFRLSYAIDNVFRIRMPKLVHTFCKDHLFPKTKYSILVIRDDGSNGDQEMCAYFSYAGFEVFNYNIKLLNNNLDILKRVNGIAFVGGFTYSDLMGGATCWKSKIVNNSKLNEQLMKFINNKSKFVIGVCNGFQLLIKLGIFGNSVSLNENLSNRFESRFIPIHINQQETTKNIFFKNMNDTLFGTWNAHKFGRIEYDSQDFEPILYYSSDKYPFNPNGSKNNVAGICSRDGRILGMMPHFERSFLNYQCATIPNLYKHIKYTPWMYMALNIIEFLDTLKIE